MNRYALPAILLVVAAQAGLAPLRPASAQSCSLTGPIMIFGTLDITSNNPGVTSGLATLTCTSAAAATIRACLSVGIGSGGTTFTNRTLSNGASGLIQYRLTSGGNNVGDRTTYPQVGPVTLSIPAGGSAIYQFPLAAQTLVPYSPVPVPSTYTTSFSGPDFLVNWTTRRANSCAAVSSGPHTPVSGTMTITAVVAPTCSVIAAPMNFGTAGLLSSARDAISVITVTCTGATPVTIRLDNGLTGTGPSTRRVTSGSNFATYGIYRDAARMQPWGQTVGTNTVTATVTGSTGFIAYGRVPPQTAPPPGTYTDVVQVNIDY